MKKKPGFFARLASLLSLNFDSDIAHTLFIGGTLHGGAAIQAIPAGSSNALFLDGKNDYIEGPTDINLGEDDFTLAAWIWKKRRGNRVIVSKGDGFKNTDQWSWGWEYPPKSFNISFRSGNRYYHSASNSVLPYRWTHVAFVRKENSGTCYINGSPSGGKYDMLPVDDRKNSLPLMVGRRFHQKSPAWFSGMIDDLRIYSRALDPEEIEQLAQMNPLKTGRK